MDNRYKYEEITVVELCEDALEVLKELKKQYGEDMDKVDVANVCMTRLNDVIECIQNNM